MALQRVERYWGASEQNAVYVQETFCDSNKPRRCSRQDVGIQEARCRGTRGVASEQECRPLLVVIQTGCYWVNEQPGSV